MLFVGKNNTEKRLTQTQIKCLLQMMGGKVATVRNDQGCIVVIGESKVGNLVTLEVLEELGAVEFRKSVRGWCLTEHGNKGARKFTYYADIDVLPNPDDNGFNYMINGVNYRVYLDNIHLYGVRMGKEKRLFDITQSDPHWVVFKSMLDKKNDLLLAGLHERVIPMLVNTDWAKSE
ncbi:MAG: hypothetical protein ACTS9Y_00290 [Methylophilus sp.]|uniref:hypothetical protein n=1 Tax=Methylophilus sp. TaxID=29541 RepID=UPI003FA0B93D